MLIQSKIPKNLEKINILRLARMNLPSLKNPWWERKFQIYFFFSSTKYQKNINFPNILLLKVISIYIQYILKINNFLGYWIISSLMIPLKNELWIAMRKIYVWKSEPFERKIELNFFYQY